MYLTCSDDSNKSPLAGFDDEHFKSGTETFHPPDAASITSDKGNNEDPNLNAQPLHPPDTYDRLPSKDVSYT